AEQLRDLDLALVQPAERPAQLAHHRRERVTEGVRVGDIVVRVPVVAPASDDEESERPLADLGDRRVKDRGPVELPLISLGGLGPVDHRVHDERLHLEESFPCQGHERVALEQSPRNLGRGDRLEPTSANVSEDPAVMAASRAGYAVEVAASGTEALERIRAASPDLMLLDYDMPDMEAPEVLDTLRSGGARIPFPVIILTGARHSPGDQVLGLERGATDYIVKGTDRQV